MKALRAISLLVSSCACSGVPCVAQHAGGGVRGSVPAAGGFAHPGGPAHTGSAPITRGATPPGGHFGAANGSQPNSARYGNAPGNAFSVFPAPGITSTRPVYFSNGFARYGEPVRGGERGRRGYGGVGVLALGYPAYLGAGDLGLGYDPEFLGATENPNEAAGPGYNSALDAFSPQPEIPEPAENSSQAGTNADAESMPGPPQNYVAAPERPASRVPAKAPAPLPEEDAVTIVFKDGRPSEQIHNYALTRSALYITTGRVRTIPIEQIDLAATEKINEKAGVDFHLPSTK